MPVRDPCDFRPEGLHPFVEGQGSGVERLEGLAAPQVEGAVQRWRRAGVDAAVEERKVRAERISRKPDVRAVLADEVAGRGGPGQVRQGLTHRGCGLVLPRLAPKKACDTATLDPLTRCGRYMEKQRSSLARGKLYDLSAGNDQRPTEQADTMRPSVIIVRVSPQIGHATLFSDSLQIFVFFQAREHFGP